MSWSRSSAAEGTTSCRLCLGSGFLVRVLSLPIMTPYSSGLEEMLADLSGKDNAARCKSLSEPNCIEISSMISRRSRIQDARRRPVLILVILRPDLITKRRRKKMPFKSGVGNANKSIATRYFTETIVDNSLVALVQSLRSLDGIQLHVKQEQWASH